jgi:hypothetical protein
METGIIVKPADRQVNELSEVDPQDHLPSSRQCLDYTDIFPGDLA